MKNFFQDKEKRNLTLIGLGVFAVFTFVAWFKGGGDFENFVGIFFGIVIFFIIGVAAIMGAMFVKHFLDEKQSKIKNTYIKTVLTRLFFWGLFFLIAILILRPF